MTRHVFDGPHGLTAIDHLRSRGFHEPQGKLYVDVWGQAGIKWVLIVKDAKGHSWVDAYWQPGGGATQEEAEKWLLDWAVIVYGGEV